MLTYTLTYADVCLNWQVRTFRVFRLVKRIPSMQEIAVALTKALPGMSNVFLILVIFISLYSILGVQFFKNDEEYGSEYFGNFFNGCFTFWQVCVGEWSRCGGVSRRRMRRRI